MFPSQYARDEWEATNHNRAYGINYCNYSHCQKGETVEKVDELLLGTEQQSVLILVKENEHACDVLRCLNVPLTEEHSACSLTPDSGPP